MATKLSSRRSRPALSSAITKKYDLSRWADLPRLALGWLFHSQFLCKLLCKSLTPPASRPAQLSPPTRTQEDRCRQSRNLGTVPGGGVHVCVKLAGARQVIFPTHRTPPPGPLPETERGSRRSFSPLRFGEGVGGRGC